MNRLGLWVAAVFLLAGCCSESKGDCKEIQIHEQTITIDGQTGDWSGIPVAIQDPRGDAVSTSDGSEIKEVSIAKCGNGLCFLLSLYGDADTDGKWHYHIDLSYDMGDGDIPQYYSCYMYFDTVNSEWNYECENQAQGYELIEVNGSSIELNVDLSDRWTSPPELIQAKSHVMDSQCYDCESDESLCVWSQL